MKHLDNMLSQIGFKEIWGGQDNPEIIKYFTALGFTADWVKDETSWCAASAYWALKEAGKPIQKKLNARSFLELPELFPDHYEFIDEPEFGCIAIYWRGKHKDELITGSTLKKGHVAFYIRHNQVYDWCFGGNQGNTMKGSAYPRAKNLKYIRVKY